MQMKPLSITLPRIVPILAALAFCGSWAFGGDSQRGPAILDRALIDGAARALDQRDTKWLDVGIKFLTAMCDAGYDDAYECLAPDIAKCFKRKEAFVRICQGDSSNAASGRLGVGPQKVVRIDRLSQPLAPSGTPPNLATKVASIRFSVEEAVKQQGKPASAEIGRVLLVKHPFEESEWRVLAYSMLPGADTVMVQAMVRLHGYFKLKGE